MNFTVQWQINGVQQINFGGYNDRDDAFRKVNALWDMRDAMLRKLGLDRGHIEFEIVGDDGAHWFHDQILREINAKPHLREPPRVW
jgi:hypothetical protein